MTTKRNTGKRGRQDWATPQWLFDKINERWGPLLLDVCAEEWSTKCPAYYTEENDGLKQNWDGTFFFCNPPFGHIQKWIAKGVATVRRTPGTRGVYLLPANTDTAWFHELAILGEIHLIRGRIQFDPPPGTPPTKSGNNTGSMIVVFNHGDLNDIELRIETWQPREMIYKKVVEEASNEL